MAAASRIGLSRPDFRESCAVSSIPVGATGFEPAKTSRPQTGRSTRLSYAPCPGESNHCS